MLIILGACLIGFLIVYLPQDEASIELTQEGTLVINEVIPKNKSLYL